MRVLALLLLLAAPAGAQVFESEIDPVTRENTEFLYNELRRIEETLTTSVSDATTLRSTWSAVGVANQSVTAHTLTTCIATVTLSLGGAGAARVSFAGAWMDINGEDDIIRAGFLVDGAYILGQTTAIGMTAAKAASGVHINNAGFSALAQNLSAGSHSFCLTMSADVNSATLSGAAHIFSVDAFW